MKSVVILMCLFGHSMAVPIPESGSNEQVAAHANEALRWMELYRMYSSLAQQGFGATTSSPNADKVYARAAASHNVFYPPPAPINSDEEAPATRYGAYFPYPGHTAPLNSDEVEEDAAATEAEAEPAENHPVLEQTVVEPVVLDTIADLAPAASVNPAPEGTIDMADINPVSTDVIDPSLITPTDSILVAELVV
ncbi:enamelin [Esox lucius]|uniref:enamelin n=1 Tax=Esox lucius TaxID=8010 RepID=UPI001476812F|nr:enamelin [Esox lucius]